MNKVYVEIFESLEEEKTKKEKELLTIVNELDEYKKKQ
jgi:hypothetical protein